MANCTVQCPSLEFVEDGHPLDHSTRWPLQSNFDISGTGVRIASFLFPLYLLFHVVLAHAEGTDIDIGGHKLHGYGLLDSSIDHSTLRA